MKCFAKLLAFCLLTLALAASAQTTVADYGEGIRITTDDGVFYLRKTAIVKINAVQRAVVIEYHREGPGTDGANTLPLPFESFAQAKAFAKEVADLTFAKPLVQKPALVSPSSR
jgi:hypothetical protein